MVSSDEFFSFAINLRQPLLWDRGIAMPQRANAVASAIRLYF